MVIPLCTCKQKELTTVYRNRCLLNIPVETCQVTHEPAKCIQLLPTHSYTAVGFNSGLVTIFTFVLASQGFGKVTMN